MLAASSFRVVAYITAYEDERAVAACVAAIQQQTFPVERIFIVDNSKQQLTLSATEGVIVEHYPENLGISGGLHRGLEWAAKWNYDFLWAFDQDSIPTANCLEILLKEYHRLSQANYQIGIIAPTAIDSRTHRVVEGAVFERDRFVGYQHPKQVQPYQCDAPITSGSLISIAAAQTISPRTELFIDGVDFDYGMQLKQQGYDNLIVPQAIMHHRFGEPIKVKLLLQERLLHRYSALRHYYMCRNHTYLEIRYAQGRYRLTCCGWRLKLLLRTIILIWLYDDAKLPKIWACILGTLHGFTGSLDRGWRRT